MGGSSSKSGGKGQAAGGKRGAVVKRARAAGASTPRKKEPETPKTSLPENPARGFVYNVKTKDLAIDPKRFQFKLNVSNAEGVNEELRAAKVFNPDFGGVLAVWKDKANGTTYVVNGHHRFDLARLTNHEHLAIRFIDAQSAIEARGIGALINIAEGRGTAVDAAKYIRDAGATEASFEQAGVSLKGKLASDAQTLAKLSNDLFEKVASGRIEVDRGLAIAKELGDRPELQNQLARVIDKAESKKGGKELSNKLIQEMAKEMAATPTETRTESSLFGDVESEHSLFVPRGEIKSFIRSELGKDRKDFEVLSSERRAANVATAGNTLNTAANKQIAQRAAMTGEDFSREVNRQGPISAAVNEFAKEYSEAKTQKARDKVKKQALEKVKKLLSESFK